MRPTHPINALLLRICLVVAAIPTGSAQPRFDYEAITLKHGLSQGMIYDIIQDREGFLWIATKDGLNRYDGYEFRVFTNDPYDPSSLSANTIVCLFEDSRGRIWVGTENKGLNVYDKQAGRFYRFQHRPGDPFSLASNRITAIAEDTTGQILVGLKEGGLNLIRLSEAFPGGGEPPQIRHTPLVEDQTVTAIAIDGIGRCWVSSWDRIYRLEPISAALQLVREGLGFHVWCRSGDRAIWAGGAEISPFWFDGERVFHMEGIRPPIREFAIDEQQRLWIVSSHGLWLPETKAVPDGPIPPVRGEPIIERPMASMVIDRSGQVWAGTRGWGLIRVNPRSPIVHHQVPGVSYGRIVYQAPETFYMSTGYIVWHKMHRGRVDTSALKEEYGGRWPHQFLIDRQGAYWGAFPHLRPNQILLWKKHPGSGEERQVFVDMEFNQYVSMLDDQYGNIWLAGVDGRLCRVDAVTRQAEYYDIHPMPVAGASKSFSTRLYEDAFGALWIGTQEGVARADFDGPKASRPRFTWYANNPEDRNSLTANYVTALLTDPIEPERYIWIATKGGGLNRLDKQTGAFFHMTEREGLPNNVVYGLLADTSGRIWGSSNKGLFCMIRDGESFVVRQFSSADGLQDDEFNTDAFLALPDGRLMFGGVNGVNTFYPDELISTDFQPPVYITNLWINNKLARPDTAGKLLRQTVETTRSITLSHSQDILTLEFASLDFTSPANNQYRYQLLGADPDWVEARNRRSATYLHLPPGTYTFRVQGTNSRGIWSPHIAELEIVMLPPWWKTWWAYAAYLLLLGWWIRFAIRFYVNREKLQARLAFETHEAERIKELDAVKTQLYTNITHEFRTPLTIILGKARQAMQEAEGSVKSSLDMIVRNGQNLLRLVNDMLDLSKLDSGKMSLQVVEGDVIEFLKYLFESFYSLGADRNIQLHFLSDLDHCTFRYDPEKWRQVMSNLLSNAIKFTPEGGHVYFSISRHADGALVIKVKDTGIGIAEGELPHIFDRFYQVNEAPTTKNEGTGIGLALTRELVRLMAGEISVKSPAPGATRGTEFTVVLPSLAGEPAASAGRKTDWVPAVIDAPAEAALPPPLEQRADFEPADKRSRLLLVEDNPDIVAYVASCLTAYRLQVAADGMEGLEMAVDQVPDLIISDVMMPRMDGFAFCRQLKADERTSHIPIIILTAKADIGSKMEGLNLGVDAYLEKPFYPEELLVRIDKLLALRRDLQRHYLRTAGLPEGTQGTGHADPLPAQTPEESTGPPVAEDAFIRRAREVVERHLTDYDFTVDVFCREMHLSQSQLHRKLDALTGLSAGQFIRRLRLQRAKELLQQPELSITAVAFDSGFQDPGYFARVFKQSFGMTPMEWRTRAASSSASTE